jgi:hypothetical protein
MGNHTQSRLMYRFFGWLGSVSLDVWLGLVLLLAGLAGYVVTLAPTVLDGDAALFQYAPYVLGVTYPTGYPVYLLLGKLWVTIFPLGQIAWRMNLFSALCGALALPFLYGAMRRLLDSRTGALAAVLLFGSLPTYWRWATEAKIYTLNVLLFSALLYTLVRGWDAPATAAGRFRSSLASWLPPLLLGLELAVHPTTVLLLPGLLLLWLVGQRQPGARSSPSFGLRRWSLVLVPLLLYFYVPLRAEWLIGHWGREEAIARGLVADFYQPGLAGWVRYFTAADFTGGVVAGSAWAAIPGRLRLVYLPLLLDDFTTWGLGLALLGAIWLAWRRPRFFLALVLIYALPIPFVLTYGQGEQNAFLLISNVMLATFAGAALAAGLSLGRPFLKRLTAPFALLMLAIFLFLPSQQARRNVAWLANKWDDSSLRYWQDVLAHPLGDGAGVMAQWGDLTTFWYLQRAENERTDLLGFYPPTTSLAAEQLGRGREVYIGGPIVGGALTAAGVDRDSWLAGVGQRYQALSWGRLVRLAPLDQDQLSLLPFGSNSSLAVFGGRLRLLGADFEPEIFAGGTIRITTSWLALADLPASTSTSLRLVDGERRLTQVDGRLLSGWFPHEVLQAGQPALGITALPVPAGTLPGSYRLELTTYQNARAEWPLPDGATVLDLGQVMVTTPGPADDVELGELKPARGVQFNREIGLDGLNLSVVRVGQGKGFLVTFLWRARRPPAADYVLEVSLVDAGGHSWRAWPSQPPAPTSTWVAGQQVRQEVPVVVPANAPVGENALRVQVRWLQADGTALARLRWGLPLGQAATLRGVRVVEKQDRLFEPPPIAQELTATLGGPDDPGQARLLGYELGARTVQPGESLPLTLYWQALDLFEETYIVFTQLLGPCPPGQDCPLETVQIYGQQDKAPGVRGKDPVTGWLPGEVVVDPYHIPLHPDAPPGEYRLIVGLYQPPDGPRLPRLDERGEPAGDFVELTRVVIKP